MTHAFKTISAKPTFGTLRENICQSDYINRKKGLINYCNTSGACYKLNISPSYAHLNSQKLGQYLRNLEIPSFNKSNLIIGQYTKLNLNDVCTVFKGEPPTQPCSSSLVCDPCQNKIPVQIDPSNSIVPFYYEYTIDPLGELFGRSQCGELNYTNYREPIKVILPKTYKTA